jgi:hypothetical protein
VYSLHLSVFCIPAPGATVELEELCGKFGQLNVTLCQIGSPIAELVAFAPFRR